MTSAYKKLLQTKLEEMQQKVFDMVKNPPTHKQVKEMKALIQRRQTSQTHRKEVCPISHNDQILDWFNRAHLYNLPRVTVLSFLSEIDSQETKVCLIATNFYGTPIGCPERELLKFSHDHLFEMKFRSLKKHYLPQIISRSEERL